MRMRATAKPAVALMLAATLSMATACTGDSGQHRTPTGAKSGSATGTAQPGSAGKQGAALPSGVTAATAVPTKVANVLALRKNVTLAACKAVPGGWAASGTARNPTHHRTTYAITVFFTTTQATVIDAAVTHVHVTPGKTATWNATRKFTAPTKTLCVLRGVG